MRHLNQPSKTEPSTQEVLKPLLYADIFDFPLTFDEIYKFLEFKANPSVVKRLLSRAIEEGMITRTDGYYSLASKPHLAAIRQERYHASQRLWPKAQYYGRWIASIPFVRLVSITGSLAVNNPRDDIDDIDFFVITSPNRLWLCRAFMVFLVRYGRHKGVQLCPNYLLTENVIEFEETNLYVARELLQMIPLYGREIYLAIRQKNDWITDYLPQGDDLNLEKIDDELSPAQRLFKTVGEFLLGGRLGDLAEKILQKRQIAKHLKLAAAHGALDKVTFTADECKGHYDGHGHKTLTAYQKRMRDYRVGTKRRAANPTLYE